MTKKLEALVAALQELSGVLDRSSGLLRLYAEQIKQDDAEVADCSDVSREAAALVENIADALSKPREKE